MLIYASAVSSSAVCEVFLGVKWLDRKRENSRLITEYHLNPVTQVRFLPRPLNRAVEQWPARKAHNLEVVGSNPASATNFKLYNYAKYELLPF